MAQDPSRLIWIDMEMSGLNPETDRVLEIAIVVTDNGSDTEIILDLTVQPDGKIIAAGISLVGSSWRTVIVRYNPNGSLDSTFGAGNWQLTSVSLKLTTTSPNNPIVAIARPPIASG